eukprot:691980-Prorocentrum_minimum.AAC.2
MTRARRGHIWPPVLVEIERLPTIKLTYPLCDPPSIPLPACARAKPRANPRAPDGRATWSLHATLEEFGERARAELDDPTVAVGSTCEAVPTVGSGHGSGEADRAKWRAEQAAASRRVATRS